MNEEHIQKHWYLQKKCLFYIGAYFTLERAHHCVSWVLLATDHVNGDALRLDAHPERTGCEDQVFHTGSTVFTSGHPFRANASIHCGIGSVSKGVEHMVCGYKSDNIHTRHKRHDAGDTIWPKMITVLTRYRPIVLELI